MLAGVFVDVSTNCRRVTYNRTKQSNTKTHSCTVYYASVTLNIIFCTSRLADAIAADEMTPESVPFGSGSPSTGLKKQRMDIVAIVDQQLE